MSFGFSVGDFLAGAQMAYTLCQSLSSAKGSAQDYRELVAELNVVHKVLLQVDQLRASNQLALATTNHLLFIVASATDAMESFLIAYESYGPSLTGDGSGNALKDVWKKGSWALQMPSRVDKLRRTLSMMLACINCLATLACYYNSEYNPRVSITVFNSFSDISTRNLSEFNDVRIEGALLYSRGQDERSAFQTQQSPGKFFRPGQVFSLKITLGFWFHNDRRWRGPVNFSRLPLEPISTLRNQADAEFLEDKKKRLAQILALPLDKMTPYCAEKRGDRSTVYCKLCSPSVDPPAAPPKWWKKEEWAEGHFRLRHWTIYRPMISWRTEGTHSNEQFSEMPAPMPPDDVANILPESWILLEDISSDAPIYSDREVEAIINECSPDDETHSTEGPSLIRRFVVVRVGVESCLCIGIHTYGGRGSGGQTDPQLHAVLHSSKDVPPIGPDEKGIILQPIRMKPEHPSTALPRSTRIHFGRAYVVSHKYAVMPLGLIHASSMETLQSQFDENVFKPYNAQSILAEDTGDDKTQPADIEVAKKMRQQIIDVLGPRIELQGSKPKKEEEERIDLELEADEAALKIAQVGEETEVASPNLQAAKKTRFLDRLRRFWHI